MNKEIRKVAKKIRRATRCKVEKNIENALSLAWQHGQIDGVHHKMWVIDQMVRTLCGSEREYEKWVEAYETPNGSEEHYEWNTGIAP